MNKAKISRKSYTSSPEQEQVILRDSTFKTVLKKFYTFSLCTLFMFLLSFYVSLDFQQNIKKWKLQWRLFSKEALSMSCDSLSQPIQGPVILEAFSQMGPCDKQKNVCSLVQWGLIARETFRWTLQLLDIASLSFTRTCIWPSICRRQGFFLCVCVCVNVGMYVCI